MSKSVSQSAFESWRFLLPMQKDRASRRGTCKKYWLNHSRYTDNGATMTYDWDWPKEAITATRPLQWDSELVLTSSLCCSPFLLLGPPVFGLLTKKRKNDVNKQCLINDQTAEYPIWISVWCPNTQKAPLLSASSRLNDGDIHHRFESSVSISQWERDWRVNDQFRSGWRAFWWLWDRNPQARDKSIIRSGVTRVKTVFQQLPREGNLFGATRGQWSPRSFEAARPDGSWTRASGQLTSAKDLGLVSRGPAAKRLLTHVESGLANLLVGKTLMSGLGFRVQGDEP